MKALKSYKTYESLYLDLIAEGITTSIYDESATMRRTADDKWESSISFDYNENQSCCAVLELGQFHLDKEMDKFWPYLLTAFLFNRGSKYYRCTTLSLRKWDSLNDALFDVGFIPHRQVGSNHGDYKVNLWEYYRR